MEKDIPDQVEKSKRYPINDAFMDLNACLLYIRYPDKPFYFTLHLG